MGAGQKPPDKNPLTKAPWQRSPIIKWSYNLKKVNVKFNVHDSFLQSPSSMVSIDVSDLSKF
jgi:hypothetical protein